LPTSIAGALRSLEYFFLRRCRFLNDLFSQGFGVRRNFFCGFFLRASRCVEACRRDQNRSTDCQCGEGKGFQQGVVFVTHRSFSYWGGLGIPLVQFPVCLSAIGTVAQANYRPMTRNMNFL